MYFKPMINANDKSKINLTKWGGAPTILAYRLFFCIFLWLTAFFLQAELITVDEIVASVNDEIITRSDIDKAIEFYPYFRKKDQADWSFYLTVLQDLINYKVVYLEYNDEVTLTDEDYTEMETAAIKKLGDYDKLMAFLGQYDMQWQDFKDFIKEKVVYEKVLKQKFQLQITIPFRDIENFYNEQYLPEQLSLHLKPKTLIEMAPLIEAKLRKDRTEERLGDWLKEITALYKIENKLLSAADSRTGLRFQSQKHKEFV